MTRTGRPESIGPAVMVKTTVPPELSDAIDALAAASGVSKYAFLRQVVIAGLQPFTLTNRDLAETLQPTTYRRKA